MKNVTLLLLKYREAARHLWNVHLRDDATFEQGMLPDSAALENWTSLSRGLYAALVLPHTGDRRLRVLPTSPTVPAMVSRNKLAKTYWDNPVQRLGPTDELRFIDFFDFDHSGFFDLTYYRVSIASSERHPELADHEALIAVQYAHVLVDDGD